LHPAPEVDVADVLSELDQEELESARLRADAVFSKLHSHHARWGGIVADEMAVHFGGENHLFEKLNSNHDGEVTSQEWREFVDVLCAERGIKTVRFFLNHIERSIELHHGDDDEEAIQSMFFRAESIFQKLENHHGKTGGLDADDVAIHFGGHGPLFQTMDRNHDGEVTTADWMSFMDSLRRQKGVKSVCFLLSHLERSVQLHLEEHEEDEVQALFERAEVIFDQISLDGVASVEDLEQFFGPGDKTLLQKLNHVNGAVECKDWLLLLEHIVLQEGVTAAKLFVSRDFESKLADQPPTTAPTAAPTTGNAGAAIIEEAIPKISQQGFSVTYGDNDLHFLVLSFRDSVLVWGGDAPGTLGHLATAIKTRWDPMPTATTVFGKADCEWAEPLASKLAKRLSTVVHLSFNFNGLTFEKQSFIQKKLAEQLPSLVASLAR